MTGRSAGKKRTITRARETNAIRRNARSAKFGTSAKNNNNKNRCKNNNSVNNNLQPESFEASNTGPNFYFIF